jgi:hypothetical protein
MERELRRIVLADRSDEPIRYPWTACPRCGRVRYASPMGQRDHAYVWHRKVAHR